MSDEITPEENEWMNAPMGEPEPSEECYRKELLAVMYRWAKESDLTMLQWHRATHGAIETILYYKIGKQNEN